MGPVLQKWKQEFNGMQGIKIVDAESKKLAKSKLLAEDKEHEMEVDKPVQRKKTVKKSKKSKAKDV